MTKTTILSHELLYGEEFAYCSHPHVATLDDGTWALVFNRAPRRRQVLHPPQDPWFANYMMVSRDEGQSWSPAVPVPAYGWTGMECAGLTAWEGKRLILNQWQFEWLTAPQAEHGPARKIYHTPADLARRISHSREIGEWSGIETAPEREFPWYLGAGGNTWVHLSDDGGWTFRKTVELNTAPHAGGYGMRGGMIMPDGSILLPMTDMPDYHVIFAVRSPDGGESWGPARTIAEVPGLDFEEPGGYVTDAGRAVILMRETKSRTLYETHSDDNGETWSPPVATGHPEYPANPFRLADGRFAVIMGRRIDPFGIRIYLSKDAGLSFDWDDPVIVRDLPNKDLGYAAAAVRRDGTIAAFYYARGEDGITAIHQTLLRIDG